MSTIRAVTEEDLPLVDQVQLLASLRQWEVDGHTNPLIPIDVDIDGDGQPDAFGLGPGGELVYVTGTRLEETVFKSDGSGLEGGQ